MNDLLKFTYGSHPVRMVMRNGQPWWVAVDVCAVLEHSNAREAIRGLDEDEKGVSIADTPGGPQETNLISESGLYTLILRSRKPQAQPFRRWITHEVLPSIRQTGGYQASPWEVPKTFAGALALAAKQAEELEHKAAEIAVLEPKAAFCDQVARAEDTHTMAEAAKALGTGRVRLFQWLRENHYLYVEGREHLPYQQYIDNGLFKVVLEAYEDSHKRDRCYAKVLVTGKGLVAIQRRMAACVPPSMLRPQHVPGIGVR